MACHKQGNKVGGGGDETERHYHFDICDPICRNKSRKSQKYLVQPLPHEAHFSRQESNQVQTNGNCTCLLKETPSWLWRKPRLRSNAYWWKLRLHKWKLKLELEVVVVILLYKFDSNSLFFYYDIRYNMCVIACV